VANDSRKWLTAAECAALTGLTVRALRVYEREGLLNPGRSAKGWRRYGPQDLVRLNTISVMKALGLTLGQIRELLRATNPSLLSVLRCTPSHGGSAVARLRKPSNWSRGR
jgi:DNA-binding transcriptional MerR regulator